MRRVIHRFGGQLTAFDRPTGVKLSVRVFGEVDSECDEATAARFGSVILEIVGRIAEESPSAAKLVADPSAFPTVIEPAIGQGLAQRGLPAVRFGSFTMSLTPESIDALKAAAQRAKATKASGIVAGAAVLVQWNDGNRYPGQVRALGDGQVQVAFPDGQVHWIAAAYVTPA